MNKDKASLMSEMTLWQLYQKLLGGRHLERLRSNRSKSTSIAVAAALAENLQPGDTIGLTANDWNTRYMCGVPLHAIHTALDTRTRPRKAAIGTTQAWAFETDADHGILPAQGAMQAGLAVGAALAARLHQTESLTVLVRGPVAKAASRSATKQRPMPEWADAAAAAVALQLPLLFVTESHAGLQQDQTRPNKPAPPMPAIPVDRSDALALYRVIYESAARARAGGGPTWIDCRDWLPETHRRASPVQVGESEGAVALLEQALRSRQLFDRDRQRHIARNLEKEFVHAGWHTSREP